MSFRGLRHRYDPDAAEFGGTGDNARTRLPKAESGVFREGYVYLKTGMLAGAAARGSFLGQLSYARSFLVLFSGELSFYESWTTLRDDSAPRDRLVLTAGSRVEDVSDRVHRPLTLAVFGDPSKDNVHDVSFSCETEEEHRAWYIAIRLEISRQRGGTDFLEYPSPRARFFEGQLFKTPPEADRWEERFFELSGDGELSYWASFGSGRKGVIPLDLCKVVPNETEASGSPTPFIFQIHTFLRQPDGSYVRRIFNLCAPTQPEYLMWLKQLRLWLGVQRPPLPDVEGAPPGRTTDTTVSAEGLGRHASALRVAPEEEPEAA